MTVQLLPGQRLRYNPGSFICVHPELREFHLFIWFSNLLLSLVVKDYMASGQVPEMRI